MVDGRTCGACGQWKPAEQFWRYPPQTPHRGGTLFHSCRSCENKKRREHNRANPTQAMQNRRKRKIRSHGIEPEDYDRMFLQQKGLCAICSRATPDGRWLHIDHDHKTGRVRGLLCHDCNRGLGMFRDDSDRLRRAIAYLTPGSGFGVEL